MKTKIVSFAFGLLVLAGGTTTASSADAAPAASPVFRMPTRAFPELKRDVAKARAADARPFVKVSELVVHAPEADAHARGRKAPIALRLAKVGPSALLPMLEMLAVDAPHGVPAEAAPAVRRDLIEAVGLLRDARALPLLSTILEDVSEDADTTRAVTEAVARLGSAEAETQLLAALDASTGDRTRAILAGLGECRRARVTEALASRLRTTTDDATARAAARSLGRSGNAWAWSTAADRSEESQIRAIAARALVDAFVRRDGEARQAASNALLVVDAPETPALVADAKKAASPETKTALDALAERFARNPARGR